MKTTIDAMKQALDLIEVLTIPTTRGTIVKRALHEAIDREEALQASKSAAVPMDSDLLMRLANECGGDVMYHHTHRLHRVIMPSGALERFATELLSRTAAAPQPPAREKPLPLTDEHVCDCNVPLHENCTYQPNCIAVAAMNRTAHNITKEQP